VPGSPLDSGWFARTVPRRPANLLWEITNACNLRCLHCESASGRKLPAELTTAEALDLAGQIVAMGWELVNVTGGEPLLRRDWPALVERLVAGGCATALITNGLAFTAETADRAARLGMRAVAVSLDGLRATHDRIRERPRGTRRVSSFDRAVGALELARAAGLRTYAITHVNLWNEGELPALRDLLAEKGVDAWQLQLGVPLGRMREVGEPYLFPVDRLPALEERLAGWIVARRETGVGPELRVTHAIGYFGRHEATLRGNRDGTKGFFFGCVGGWMGLGLTADGLVKPCAILPREFAVGDVRREKLAAIWDDADRFAFQSHWDERKLEGTCRDCAYRHLCRAGCTGMAYGLTGSIYNNPYCVYGQTLREGGR
jgi:radical SAM protein with 4Fe4S-binding SPASM domain